MKKTIIGKILATLALTVLLASTVTTTAFAKTIPNEYREFTRKGSFYYHTLTMYTNYEVETGKIVKEIKTPDDGTPFEAYYVSIGGHVLNC